MRSSWRRSLTYLAWGEGMRSNGREKEGMGTAKELPLLLLDPLTNEESVERIMKQLVSVCRPSTGPKTTLLTKQGF